MQIINDDLIKAFQNKDIDVLIHQVNCQGKMGSGIAGKIKAEYPIHFDDYKKYTRNVCPRTLLGNHLDTVLYDQKIVGMFSQETYGYDGKLYTSYAAFSLALDNVIKSNKGKIIGLPYCIGCGYGGGDWKVISSIIQDLEKINNTEILVYRLV